MRRFERLNWRRRLRGWWRQLKQEQATPGRLGAAVAVGVLVGCSPFWGLQIVLALALAWVFRLNKLAVLLGSQISTPPFTPFFMLGTAQVGELLLRRQALPLSLAQVRTADPVQFAARLFGDMLLGSIVVGGLLAAVLGGATTAAVRRYRTRSTDAPALTDDERDALSDRLARAPRWYRSYGWWKIRLDPAYPMVLDAVSEARDVVDLGAGIALLDALLAHRRPVVRVRAVEWDERKAAVARQVVSDLPQVSVEQSDARAVALGTPDAILLVDVLHYAPVDEQREWLARCADSLRPGGVLVIRELDSKPSGYNAAERLDRLAVALRMNRGGGVHAWPIAQMTALLRDRGFDVSVLPAGKGLFAANALITARKVR